VKIGFLSLRVSALQKLSINTNFVLHEIRVNIKPMKNITITMEDDVAEWVRIEAAKRNASISRLMGEWVAQKMRQEDAYEQAMRASLKFETWGASLVPSQSNSKAKVNQRDVQYDRPAGIR
jgi:predicted transcriptional regulator